MGNMSPVDRALWRIAELGARYRDPSSPTPPAGVWEELETAVSEARAMYARTHMAAFHAQRRTKQSEAQIDVLCRDRDRARTRVFDLRKAVKDARAEAAAEQSRAQAAEAARDELQADLRRALARCAAAETALAAAEAARAAAEVERDDVLAARMAAPTAPPAEVEIDLVAEEPAVTVTVGFTAPAPNTRYIRVGATLGNLLPEDMSPFLVKGAEVVRREGRLAAIIAVPSPTSEWEPSWADEQLGRLVAEGFRAEQWDGEESLAS